MIPIIDIFAGPGGLGEGFSAFTKGRAREQVFRIARSFEKDAFAHATLRFRALSRLLGNGRSNLRVRFMRSEMDWPGLAAAVPDIAQRANDEAQLVELGAETATRVREMIDESLGRREAWVLVGGPPCQAYSLVGRARNNGNKGYEPKRERLEALYVEYLQILADHAPPVFVMENVKGLLSVERDSLNLFDRIREDLMSPVAALRREGRPTRRLNPQYEIHALTPRSDFFGNDPRDYVIRCEEFGVPQRRHRVILLGIRRDMMPGTVPVLEQMANKAIFSEAVANLPRLRSGISRGNDAPEAWRAAIRRMRSRPWLHQCDALTRSVVRDAVDQLTMPRADRGGEYVERDGEPPLLNHSSRSHMVEDLERYMFASSFATAHGRSPVLDNFPNDLLPNHSNIGRVSGRSLFADRFRVQLANKPATTVTSHISQDGHYYIHPDSGQCRSLTVREAAALQTFPADYFFCGPRTEQYRQVGNAVPPLLASRIAGVVAEVLGV